MAKKKTSLDRPDLFRDVTKLPTGRPQPKDARQSKPKGRDATFLEGLEPKDRTLSETNDVASEFTHANFVLRNTPARPNNSARGYTLHLPDEIELTCDIGDEEASPSVRRQASVREHRISRSASTRGHKDLHLSSGLETVTRENRTASSLCLSASTPQSMQQVSGLTREGSRTTGDTTIERKRKRQTEEVNKDATRDESDVQAKDIGKSWAIYLDADGVRTTSSPFVISSSAGESLSPSPHRAVENTHRLSFVPRSIASASPSKSFPEPDVSEGKLPPRKAATQAIRRNQKLSARHPRFKESKRGRR